MNVAIEKSYDSIKLIFPNDIESKRLKLLVILSPIFIASFDNGTYELEFLKNTIKKSKYPYGLYPNFFNDFNIKKYRDSYDSYKVKEDIFLNSNNEIEFVVNPMNDIYIKALSSLIEAIIIDDKSNEYFTNYFAKIRDDIVINGRRSIIANGIQGFYLSKYIVVWMINLCDYIKKDNQKIYKDTIPIYELSNNLKSIRTNISKQ